MVDADQITAEDARLDHRITVNAMQEVGARPEQIGIDAQPLLCIFRRGDRRARCDVAEQRQFELPPHRAFQQTNATRLVRRYLTFAIDRQWQQLLARPAEGYTEVNAESALRWWGAT